MNSSTIPHLYTLIRCVRLVSLVCEHYTYGTMHLSNNEEKTTVLQSRAIVLMFICLTLRVTFKLDFMGLSSCLKVVTKAVIISLPLTY